MEVIKLIVDKTEFYTYNLKLNWKSIESNKIFFIRVWIEILVGYENLWRNFLSNISISQLK